MVKHITLFLLLSVFLIVTVALSRGLWAQVQVQNQSDPVECYRSAIELYASGKYKEAEAAFKRAIDLNPYYAEAYRDLGNTYFDWRRYEESEEAFSQAFRIKGPHLRWDFYETDWMDALVNFGTMLAGLGKHDESLSWFLALIDHRAYARIDEIVHLKADIAEAYFALGVAYQSGMGWSGKYEIFRAAAIESFKKAIQIKPDYAEVYNYLGCSYGLCQPEESIDAYKKAIQIKPDMEDAYNGLGLTYADLHRYEEAVDCYKKAISLKPRFVGVYFNLARAYLDMGDREAALKQYERLKKIEPEMAKELYQQIKEYDPDK